MIIATVSEVKEVPVSTIWLTEDIDDPQGYRAKMFFCFNCQNPLIQYKGKVANIVPGMSPYKTGTILMCKNCKHRFMFIV